MRRLYVAEAVGIAAAHLSQYLVSRGKWQHQAKVVDSGSWWLSLHSGLRVLVTHWQLQGLTQLPRELRAVTGD